MSVLALEVSSRLGELELSVALDAGPAPLAIAGPSGAGKTSLLRMLAGLMRPLSGWIRCGAVTWFDGAARVDVPPEARRCGLVFQDYALFPHLRAWENVAFGAGGGRRARRRRAFDMLERFGMGQRALARPGELSGGERQRVALARALAREPRLLLLDEPLAALDPGTRLRSGRELGAIVADAGIPVVLVTHDFAEAASLADDIAVLERGAIVQRGSPRELAARPGSAFVADLTGASVLAGVAADGPDGLAVVSLEGGGTIVSTEELRGPVAASVHPWEVALEPASDRPHGSAQNRLRGRVVSVVPLGSRVRVALEAGGPLGSAPTPTSQPGIFLSAEVTEPAVRSLGLKPGSEVIATWKATATRLAPR